MTIKRNSKENRWRHFPLIRGLLQASALLTLLFSTATLQAQVKVLEVRDLKFLPGDAYSSANDINNLGEVVGVSTYAAYYYGSSFLWTEAGGMQKLPISGRSEVFAINDHSQMAGSDAYCTSDAGCTLWAAFWEPAPGYEEYRPCYRAGDWGDASAYDINNRGQVVAYCDGDDYEDAPVQYSLVVWSREADRAQQLPVLPGGSRFRNESRALGINDLGQIAGASQGHAVLWNRVSNGYRIQDLGLGTAYAINSLGQIVGEKGGRAVLWNPSPSGYKIQDLGPGVAYAINDLGMVVGESGGHAFVWTATGGMQDLGILSGFSSSVARAINNLGQVVGSNQVRSWNSDSAYWEVSQSHATLWTLSLPDDTTPPSCAVTGSGTNAAGQSFTKISCQDTGSGLASIHVIKSSNYTAKIPSFSVGTTSPVVVTATKIDNALSSWVTLGLDDVAGNVGFYDPVELEIERTKGKPQSQTLTGIPEAESLITIYNHNPGLTALFIEVNGVKFMIPGLRDNEVRNIDVSPVMAAEDNTMTFQTHGRPGGSATILIHERSDTDHRVRRHANWR